MIEPARRVVAPRILVSVAGFGRADQGPLRRLRATGWDVDVNESGKRLNVDELMRRAEGVQR